jgi:hypothetical protein
MNRILPNVLLALLAVPSIAAASVSGEQMRDQVITIVTDSDWNDHTCRRVDGLGKNTVSPSECRERLNSANSQCIELAKSKVPIVLDEDQAKFLVDILMSCPIAKVLDIGYEFEGTKIHIQWSELNR